MSDLFPPVAFGGYERECAVLAEGLASRHEVLVLTSDLDRGRTRAEPHVRRELPWNPRGRVWATLLAPQRAAVADRVTKRVMATFHPDVIVVYNMLGVPQAALLAALHSQRPVVLRLAETYYADHVLAGDRYLRHLLGRDPGPRGAWSQLLRTINRHPRLQLDPGRRAAAAVAWGSEALRRETALPLNLQVDVERVVHPVTPDALAFSSVVRAPRAHPTVVFLGRVNAAKGIDVAYRAVALLRSRHQISARLIVIGPSDRRTQRRLARLATTLDLGTAVQQLGRLDAAQTAEVLAGAHVMVVPSVVPDVFPLVLIEAGLAQVPVVASRVGGIPEAVTDETHALLFPPGDAAACAHALARTLTEHEATSERCARAHELAQSRSTVRYVTEWDGLLYEAVTALGRARVSR
ncbi:MAG: colanic acid biosynthesis glycosyltransferase WcaL [Frankiales bacterium]|nr:colanic acid biosynthesis glycosyltransferase WcaL [Frankiales bacterium]